MNFFITATDTDVGKTYVSRGIVQELLKRGKKVAYFKPFQSGIIANTPSDAEIVSDIRNKNLTVKNSYITHTPSTPSISAKIDNVTINIDKVIADYAELSKNNDMVITEGSGGLFVPVNDDFLISDVIKKLELPCIIIARPNLGTINHTLLTINALYNLNIKILGVIISNYPKDTKDPVITTAPELIKKFSSQFGGIRVIDIIKNGQTDFSKTVDKILN